MEINGSALVTGASRGLGRALALELSRQGFEVVASMRHPRDGAALPEMAAAEGGRLRVERLDLDDPASIAIPQDLQVLINNAGIETAYLPAEHTPPEAWRRVFETNFFGLVETVRQALPRLKCHPSSVICNVTSASLLVPMPFYAVYRASKAAVQAYGESLQAEVAPFGVRVIEVMPGPIDTDLLAGSDRVPEAADCEGYEALAEWAYTGRKGSEMLKTPAEDAARKVVSAILDDTAPYRVACDPMGEAMIPGADAGGYEDRLRGILAAMKPHRA